jgi:hypothetical protein
MFFESNCCWVSSGTVSARYCFEPARRERREADQEEVEARERNHVDGELAEIAVKLTREAEAARRAADRRGEDEVTVRRRRELERADGTIELGAAAKAAPAVTLPPPLWVVVTLLIGFCFLRKWPRAGRAPWRARARSRGGAGARARPSKRRSRGTGTPRARAVGRHGHRAGAGSERVGAQSG